ncbi:acid sphingomyelinase-like phosphodiesterase 3a isoform X1 [Scyliorhinus canicula]|uniref:acid sphingomyelinase-like phosphodiesterase 3a isoform X1 n=1 Tax=Scyliorhinus canicula TaxID=7830 RepID=UPI0018F66DCE|nr:acid sphingomyelinase-like phosphodiesterase 3a isoform X1 [Scyliorhinus canicula]
MEARVAVVCLCFSSLCAFIPNASAFTAALHRKRVGGRAAGQFWHITDLHLDPTYHLTKDPTKVCFSSMGRPAKHAGPYGDYLCDSPYNLIQSALTFMKDAKVQPSFMIWTGDSPPHVPVPKLSTKIVIDILHNMTQTIRQYFKDLQVFPTLGNHDYWPQDQLPVNVSEVYNAAADMWKQWLTSNARRTLQKGGFYTQVFNCNVTQQTLRIISLNTNLYYGPNKVTEGISDPAGQFAWLEDTLKRAQQNKERVYLIAHVPLGYLPDSMSTTAIREKDNERLLQILCKYSDVIDGQFFGHTHKDSIMVLLDNHGYPINSLFVAPAVTPQRRTLNGVTNNPGLRLYKYDTNDYTLLDFWQYYLNLTEANEEKRPDWKLEYIMTEAYGIKDVQPESLYDLTNQFIGLHSKKFQMYYDHYFVNYNISVRCVGLCKVKQICAIKYLDHAAYTNCILRGIE